tara:strand:- start:1599 stop:2075 length:477 start_codon:yes stop_codon:yes gene_type:complete
MTKYWLMKSELDVYPWEKLVREGQTHWDGVRNYQARNIMRDEMKKGDLVLFYHSNCKPPHIAGIARIVKESYPDFTSWDSKSKYFDSKSTPENPRWFMVDIEPLVEINKIGLPDLRMNPALEGMPLLMKGSRLSVQPVPEKYFSEICEISGIKNIKDL